MAGLDTELTPQEIGAIVSLLADADERTDALIAEQLIARPAASRAAVLSRAKEAGVWVEARLERVLRQNARERIAGRFAALPLDERGQVDLEDAAFLVAHIVQPEFNTRAYQRQLDKWAEDVFMAMAPNGGPAAGLDALCAVLFQHLGLHGEHDDYYSPQNSSIPYAMDTRKGLPITLAVVALLVAKRLQLPLRGIGMPGHFVLRYDLPSAPVYIDAFEGGELLSAEECEEKIRSFGYKTTKALIVAGSTAIVVRMLRNLSHAYQRLEDREGEADCQACLNALVAALPAPE